MTKKKLRANYRLALRLDWSEISFLVRWYHQPLHFTLHFKSTTQLRATKVFMDINSFSTQILYYFKKQFHFFFIKHFFGLYEYIKFFSVSNISTVIGVTLGIAELFAVPSHLSLLQRFSLRPVVYMRNIFERRAFITSTLPYCSNANNASDIVTSSLSLKHTFLLQTGVFLNCTNKVLNSNFTIYSYFTSTLMEKKYWI